MAALLSRRRLGTLGLLQSSGLALVEPSRLAFRGYAAAAVATKQNRKAATTAAAKAAPTTKSATPKTAPTVSPKAVVKKPAAQSTTTKTPPTSPKVVAKKPAAQSPITKTPLTPPKVAAKKPAAQSTATKSVTAPSTPPKGSIKKPASQSATTKVLTAAATPPKVTAQKPAAGTIPKKTVTRPERPRLLDSRGKPIFRVPAKKFEELSEEEQLAQLEQVYSMSKFQPTRDIWGHSTGAFDVILPYSTTFSQRSKYSSWREMFEQFKENRRNTFKNYTSMAMLAWDNAIPGIDLSGHRWWHKYLTQWPWRLASTTSIAKGSWLSPLRTAALDSYCQLYTALAKGNDQTLRELTSDTYQDQVLLMRKKQKRDCKYIWHFHKEVTPARVLSIRATQGYLAQENPKFGNRYIIQAIVRIDTEQSLEIYTNQGVPLHTRAATPVKGGSSAEPVRVTEYFVFEKKMWYDGPWRIREQLWETSGKKAAI